MTTHRCFMRYELIFNQWRVAVLRDGRTLRELVFDSEHKLEEMAKRGGGLRSLADRQALEFGIRQGHGGLDLYLTDDQLSKLKRNR